MVGSALDRRHLPEGSSALAAFDRAHPAPHLQPAAGSESRERRHSHIALREISRAQRLASPRHGSRLLRRRHWRESAPHQRPAGPRRAAAAAQPGRSALGPAQAPRPLPGPRPGDLSLRSMAPAWNVPALAACEPWAPPRIPAMLRSGSRASVVACRPSSGPICLRVQDPPHYGQAKTISLSIVSASGDLSYRGFTAASSNDCLQSQSRELAWLALSALRARLRAHLVPPP